MKKGNFKRIAAILVFFAMLACLVPRIITTHTTSVEEGESEPIGAVEQLKEFAAAVGLRDTYATGTTEAAIYYVEPYSTYAEVKINVSSASGGNVNVGVVYSDTITEPFLNVSGVWDSGERSLSPGVGTITLSNLRVDTVYYAKVYCYLEGNPSPQYSTVRSFRTSYSGNSPTVYTSRIVHVSDNYADIQMEVTNSGASSIASRGIVYSRYNSSPSIGGSNSYIQYTSGTTGSTTVRISGLSSHTTYYARAFATNGNGTTAYGSVVSFYTSEYDWYNSSSYSTSSWLSTKTVTDITDSTAVAGGSMSSYYYDGRYYDYDYYYDYNYNGYRYYTYDDYYYYNYKDRGVVYSSTNRYPTISDYSASSGTSSSYRDFTVDLNNLDRGTTYYVRAYVRTSSGYNYGDVVTFTTKSTGTSSAAPSSTPKPAGDVDLTFYYKTQEGAYVGTQEMKVDSGTVITRSDLSIPDGYRMVDGSFSYTARGIAMVNVTVRKIGAESPYMSANGNLFEPNRNITRIEVAKMIYNLKDNAYEDAEIAFTDVIKGNADESAIRYVVAMGYMSGYPDGTFRPNNDITRAEVAVIVNQVYGLIGGSSGFSDTSGHWADKMISSAAASGMLSGYPDGTFKPDANMTRAEACALFARAEKRNLTPLGTTQFIDVPTGHWAYRYIMNAAIAVQ